MGQSSPDVNRLCVALSGHSALTVTCSSLPQSHTLSQIALSVAVIAAKIKIAMQRGGLHGLDDRAVVAWSSINSEFEGAGIVRCAYSY